jgi:hypothetical protein
MRGTLTIGFLTTRVSRHRKKCNFEQRGIARNCKFKDYLTGGLFLVLFELSRHDSRDTITTTADNTESRVASSDPVAYVNATLRQRPHVAPTWAYSTERSSAEGLGCVKKQ